MDKKQFPNWIFKENNGQPFAFKDLESELGFKVAVRVGWEGVSIFAKQERTPNLYYMNPVEFASLEDFKGTKGQGFEPYLVGATRVDDSYWFSDCIFEPGLTNEDFIELKEILFAFHEDCKKVFLHSK